MFKNKQIVFKLKSIAILQNINFFYDIDIEDIKLQIHSSV